MAIANNTSNIKYLSRSESSGELAFLRDGKVVTMPVEDFRPESEFGQCMDTQDLHNTIWKMGYKTAQNFHLALPEK